MNIHMWVYKRSFEISDSKTSTPLSFQTAVCSQRHYFCQGLSTLLLTPACIEIPPILSLGSLCNSPHCKAWILLSFSGLWCSTSNAASSWPQDCCSLTSAGFAEQLYQGTCTFAGLETLLDQWSWVFQVSRGRAAISHLTTEFVRISKSPFPLTALAQQAPRYNAEAPGCWDWYERKMQGTQTVMDTTREARAAQSPRSYLREVRNTLANGAFCFSCTLACQTVFVIF